LIVTGGFLSTKSKIESRDVPPWLIAELMVGLDVESRIRTRGLAQLLAGMKMGKMGGSIDIVVQSLTVQSSE
jgi:hypothetical protein